MGCVNSRGDINDVHANVFRVMNVDEQGQQVSGGQLELTAAELVLHQRGRAAARWPLRCLRRYGFDEHIFSFESGRRCPTGPGIYAFRCQRAEQLFNLLQHNIQLLNMHDDAVAAAPPPPVTARLRDDVGYFVPRNTEHNNNSSKRAPHSYSNTLVDTVYMNVDDAAGDLPPPLHCYANLMSPPEAAEAMNYIVLDLDPSNGKEASAASSPPDHGPQGYATIDFNKTVALSHSVHPCLDLDNEGSRKTRHNSTIAPILARHSTSPLSD